MTQNPFEDAKPHPTEYRLHIACVKHIESCFIGTHNPNLKFWHVPNQTRDATEAFFNKQMGVLPGVSDLMFGWPNSKVGVIELKLPGKKLSTVQNKFISWAGIIGWETGSAWTVRDLHNILIKWGLKPVHHSIMEPDQRTEKEKLRDSFDFYKR